MSATAGGEIQPEAAHAGMSNGDAGGGIIARMRAFLASFSRGHSLQLLEEKDSRHQRLWAFAMLGALCGATAYSTAFAVAVAFGAIADVRAAIYILSLGCAGTLVYLLGMVATYNMLKRLLTCYAVMAMVGAALYFLGFVAAMTASTTSVGEAAFLRTCLSFINAEYTQKPVADTIGAAWNREASHVYEDSFPSNITAYMPYCCLCGEHNESVLGGDWYDEKCVATVTYTVPAPGNATDTVVTEWPSVRAARSWLYQTYPKECRAQKTNKKVILHEKSGDPKKPRPNANATNSSSGAGTGAGGQPGANTTAVPLYSTRPNYSLMTKHLLADDWDAVFAEYDFEGPDAQTESALIARDLVSQKANPCLCDCAQVAAAPTNRSSTSVVAKVLEAWDPIDCPVYYDQLRAPTVVLSILCLIVSLALLYSCHLSFELSKMRGMV